MSGGSYNTLYFLLFILVYPCLKGALPHPLLLINFGYMTLNMNSHCIQETNKGENRTNPHFLKYKDESQESGEYFLMLSICNKAISLQAKEYLAFN